MLTTSYGLIRRTLAITYEAHINDAGSVAKDLQLQRLDSCIALLHDVETTPGGLSLQRS
jgi:hypothetical protein